MNTFHNLSKNDLAVSWNYIHVENLRTLNKISRIGEQGFPSDLSFTLDNNCTAKCKTEKLVPFGTLLRDNHYQNGNGGRLRHKHKHEKLQFVRHQLLKKLKRFLLHTIKNSFSGAMRLLKE